MAILDACHELDDLGAGQFRHTAHLRPVAFLSNGNWASINSNFVNGDANFPHVVTAAKMLLYNAGDGLRRICPTGDPSVYFEIGAPYIKPAGTWQKVNLGSVTRTGNKLSWSIAQADVNIWHAGHFCKLEIALKGGYVPPNGQFAFPIGLNGLTRSGTDLLFNGQVVMTTQKPVVYDAANPLDVRPVTMSVVNVSGQNYILFTLPSLTGMTSPVVDPTLTLQPDATAGLDSYLYQSGPNTNFGTADQLSHGRFAPSNYRHVIQFDLSSIQSTASIGSADMDMTCLDAVVSNDTVQWFRIKSAWVESQVTWNNRITATAWATAGCDNTTSDREATGIGSASRLTTDVDGTVKTVLLTAGVGGVQDWVSGAMTNNGLLGKGNNETTNSSGSFHSSDATTAAYRPKLVVVYTVPSFDGGGIVFRPGRRWLRGRVA